MKVSTDNTSVGFEVYVKPLFRASDVITMLTVRNFDLSKYSDVVARADHILQRLEDGDMPCDGAWPPEKVAIFRKWISDGKRP
jgi:hypothetical protein